MPNLSIQEISVSEECEDSFNAIPGVARVINNAPSTKRLKVLVIYSPAAAAPIERLPRVIRLLGSSKSLRSRGYFRHAVSTLLLFTSVVQATYIPIPHIDSEGPEPIWPDKIPRVNSTLELYKTGDLPIAFGIYHRIQQDIDSYQSKMTSLFDKPISTEPPLDMFPRKYHPVSRKQFLNVADDAPLPTNKFYTNLFLDSQQQGVWTAPYMLWFNKNPNSFGISISHVDANQLALGPEVSPGVVEFYIAPLGIASTTLGAREFNSNTSTMRLTDPTDSSVNMGIYADLAKYGPNTKKMVLPLVQGMGFVSAEYTDLSPTVSSGVLYRHVEASSGPFQGCQKWKLTLEDGKFWFVYAIVKDGGAPLSLVSEGNGFLGADRSFTGYFQVSKVGDIGFESIIDSAAGAYPVTRILSAIAQGSQANYTFEWQKRGQSNSGNLLMYAFKHHVASFNPATAAGRTGLVLNSTTKGVMEAVRANSWTMVENQLPTNIGFVINNGAGLSSYARQRIQAQVVQDLNTDFVAATGGESWYFSGKAFGKIAQTCLTASTVGLDDVAREALGRLKTAFAKFVQNHPTWSLVYDTNFKGIVSDVLFQTGDPGRDFGNSNYNDHHFHYGYHVYTAAIIVYLDKKLNNNTDWLVQNSVFIYTLLRDVANPHSSDKYFSVNRAFDIFHGHSWAKGLFESADGKDQESSSEDMHFAYAMKLWGSVTGDAAMEGRGNMQLAIMSRSFNEYFLLKNGNTTHPAKFTPNKVTGILFENKAHHTTYFGHLAQYIQGIHMLPFTAIMPYYRSPQFCAEEWETWFQGKTGNVTDGWKSVLYANVALFQPVSSWLFFDQPNYDPAWTSDGATRSWNMLNAALLGGSPATVASYQYGGDQPIYRNKPSDHYHYGSKN